VVKGRIDAESLPLLIRRGRIVDPSQAIDQVSDLLVYKGNIEAAGGEIAIQPDRAVIDATGLVVCPGFVDLHCHLREPGFEDKETIATGTRAAAIGGFTTICCMANTSPPLDNPIVVAWVRQQASKEGIVDVLPICCVTKGRKGEQICDFAELAEAGAIAFSDDGSPVSNSEVMRRALDYCHTLGLPIIDHCEDQALSNGGIINKGWVSSKLGLKGIPAVAEESMVVRDLALAKLTGAKLHIAHVSTRGSVELIRRAKEDSISVTAEVTPHHLTLTEETILGRDWRKNNNTLAKEPQPTRYDTNAKVYPPLRTKEDVECLIEALDDGVIDAIATDHAPHTLADKNCDLYSAAFGITGFETAFGCLMSLVHKGKISLPTLISKLTREPARIIGRDTQLGSLKVGAPGDITILDPNREWVVNSGDFASKGRNTPFDGHKFKGKVVATIVNGKAVYADSSLVIAKSAVTKQVHD
jgi:dihydroorotase